MTTLFFYDQSSLRAEVRDEAVYVVQVWWRRAGAVNGCSVASAEGAGSGESHDADVDDQDDGSANSPGTPAAGTRFW